MPSLIRLLIAIAVMVGGLYGGAYALVAFYEPEPREMSERVRNLEIEAVPDKKPAIASDDASETKPVGARQ